MKKPEKDTKESAELKSSAVPFLPHVNAIFYSAATTSDIPALANVIATAFEEHRGKLDPPSSSLDKSAESVAQELQTAKAIVATSDKVIIGCVFYSAKGDHVYLAHLAVLPEYRGLGVARALINAVEQETLTLELCRVRLSVRLAMETTKGFYESLKYAFHSYGSHTGYPRPTYVNLERQLQGEY